jgi:hypothetical protein
LDELKSGMHVKGRTVAEMGSGNTPIDMTTITKGGETYLIMGNTARSVSEVNYKTIAAFEGTLTQACRRHCRNSIHTGSQPQQSTADG